MPTTHGVSALGRHEEYYLRDGNICFLVEKTLFRLHKHFFERESEYFRAKLSPSTQGEDGSLDSPYIIDDVKVEEFAQFVWIWYNPHYSFSKKGKDHWLTILRLATQWQFGEVRSLAIRQLERLDLQPVEKIAIYKQYKVDPHLLLPSYMSLCRKEKLPSPEEGHMLSMETVLKLAHAREQILLSASENGCKSPTTASAPDDVATPIIAKLFDLALRSNDQTDKGKGKPNGNAAGGGNPQPKGGRPSVEPSQNTTNGTGASGGFGKSRNRAYVNLGTESVVRQSSDL